MKFLGGRPEWPEPKGRGITLRLTGYPGGIERISQRRSRRRETALSADQGFDRDIQAPRQARAWMNGVLGDRMGIDDVERADLILSELVTNAVVHGNSAALVRVRLEAHSLRIEVDDASPVIPIPREPDDYGGRGLRIVDQMTARWGTESRATGKTVWALLEH